MIDDNPDDIFITKRAIMKSAVDFAIEEASDGFKAMERLRMGNPPHLILLDLKMPGAGGLEILQFIRAQEKTRYVPVVMVTSSKMDEDMKAAYDAGANGFLHKSHDLTEFTENLKTALHYWININLSPF
jgi:two-component system response regulator